MGPVHSALVFSRDALMFGVALQPTALIAVVALISLVRAGIKQRPFRMHLWKAHHWLSLSHLLFFAAAITVGVLCAAPLTGPPFARSPNRAGVRYLDVVMYGSFASCVFWIWRMKGFRWFACSLMALMEVPVLGALFVAGMSVTGDWL
jgi:hypothetical protein